MARATKAPDPQPAPATVAEAIDRWNALSPHERQQRRAACEGGHAVVLTEHGVAFCANCCTVLVPEEP